MTKQILILLIFPFTLAYSQSGTADKFFAERSVSNAAKLPGDKTEITFSVFSGENELYQISRLVDYDEPFPSVKVFDDGSAAVVFSFDARIELVDNSGNSAGDIQLFKEPRAEYERTIYTSSSGSLLAAVISEPERDESEAVILDNRGNIFTRFNIESGYVSGVLLSSENSLVVISEYSWDDEVLVEAVKIYSIDGEPVNSLDIQFNHAEISDGFLFGYNSRKYFSAALDDLSRAAYGETEVGEIVLGMIMYNNKFYLAVSKHPRLAEGKWLYKGIEIKMYDRMLKNHTSVQYPEQRFSEFTFSVLDGNLSLITDQTQITIK